MDLNETLIPLTYSLCRCASWTWYYPHLYAPLASDLVDLAMFDVRFEQGEPFTPLMQLLSVLPPQSSGMLPTSYKDLMIDPASPLVEYYPKDFEVDSNGKKNSWECIVRIPFINEQRLMKAVSAIDHKASLLEKERMRNIAGQIFIAKPSNPKANSDRPRAGVDLVDHGGWGNALTDDRKRHRRDSKPQFSKQYTRKSYSSERQSGVQQSRIRR